MPNLIKIKTGIGIALILGYTVSALGQVASIRSSYENPVYTGDTNTFCSGVVGGVGGVNLHVYNYQAAYSVSNVPVDLFVIREVQVGAPAGAVVANYGFGDELLPPEGAKEGVSPTIVRPSGNVLWLDYADMLLAIDGGAAIVQWVMEDGETNTMTYAISPTPTARPVRLYWTDDESGTDLQYGGPTVEFGSNYRVDLYPSSTVNINADDYQWGYTEAVSNSPTYDVWLTLGNLHAKEDVKGKFLLTYSRTDEYGFQQHLGHEVVEVLAPMSEEQFVNVGDRLQPVQRSYEIDDLFATITRGATGSAADNFTDIFAYKHELGDKSGWVWALKETSATGQIEIYWKAKEQLDVIWPFEVDIYDVSWGDDLQPYIRGDLAGNDYEPHIHIPSELAAEVLPYQSLTTDAAAGQGNRGSDEFAFAEDGILYTTGLGKFLMRYSSEECVWFEALEAISHEEFSDSLVATDIATPLQPASDADAYAEWPGYLYTPHGTAYNTSYYSYPTSYLEGSDSTSSIFPVNRGELEVWWANESKFWTLSNVDEDEVKLSSPIYYPSWVNVYTNDWPADAHQIVIASGKGNTGLKVSTNAVAVLPTVSTGSVVSDSFSIDGSFTIEAWVNPYSTNSGALFAAGAADTLWSLDFEDGVCGLSQSSLMLSNFVTLSTGEWSHVAMVYRESGELGFYVNGARQAFVVNDELELAVTSGLNFGQFDGLIDEVRIWDSARSAEELQQNMRIALPSDSSGLAYLASFDPDDDQDYGITNRVAGGCPEYTGGFSLAGSSPEVYMQADETAHGYNPNEEHALIFNRTVYALRCDLNETNETSYTSDPFVLLNITDPDGMQNMAIFEVLVTNELYQFEQFLDAGQLIQAPAPLNLMAPVWMSENSFDTNNLSPYRDRVGNEWAHQAGNLGEATNAVANLYYPSLSTFWYPEGEGIAEGAAVPLADGISSDPVDFNYVISWPETVPELYVGDTLTEPKDGLPAVRGQLSVEIAYEQSKTNSGLESVLLIDPTRACTAPLTDVPTGMKNYRDPATGFTYFSDLPPALRERLYWNGTADASERLQLVGEYVTRTDGYNYLLLNMLTQSNRVNALCDDVVTGLDETWIDAVTNLPSTIDGVVILNDETPVDSYALSTVGKGAGYVTLVFNDSTNEQMVAASENVDMVIIKVMPELFEGRLDTLLSDNPLDKQLTLKYTADFAGSPENFEFEWDYADPENGSAPDEESTNWKRFAKMEGLHYSTVGGAGVFGLSDHYLRCRYRALDSDVISLVGTNWSSWTPPQLAEGWIKRALKAINPYEQRIQDYMNYELNTSLSMLQQAGKPYSGDVALNYSALDDYGLIPIYETIYLQSLDLCKNATVSDSLFLALMMVSGRLSDLYMLYGNEAYADALNPIVTLGGDDPVGTMELTSIFCFQNQMDDLLSEELALLRGRDDSMSPAVSEYPLYNRMVPNFTADIVGGEVAYALNYGISDIANEDGELEPDGSVDEYDALALYPQGHGDAWGHYLKAIKYYYAALHASNFEWLPQVEGVIVGDSEVTVSYLHEKKFAAAAAAKAQVGLDVLNKTWRHSYSAGQENNWDALEDGSTNAWGVAEWASRAGQGTYFDWLAGNSLLPAASSPDDTGIRVIDRTTVTELTELTAIGKSIQSKLDGIDAGLNPLGIAENTIPFDISADEIDAGETHFEQIASRADAALQTACEIFDRVQTCTKALRDQNEAGDYSAEYDDEEAGFTRRLIEIYGYPYSDDIGPECAYEEGYSGPDLLHYNYVENYTDMGNLETATFITTNYACDGYTTGTYSSSVDLDDDIAELFNASYDNISVTIPLMTSEVTTNSFYVNASGVPTKPDTYMGTRRAEGEVQIALSAYLEQLSSLEAAYNDCTLSAENIKNVANSLSAKYLMDADVATAEDEHEVDIEAMEWTSFAVENLWELYDAYSDAVKTSAKEAAEAAPTSLTDVGAAARATIAAVNGVKSYTDVTIEKGVSSLLASLEKAISELEGQVEDAIAEAEGNYDLALDLIEMKETISAQSAPLINLNTAMQAAETARMVYMQSIAEGDALQVERESMRMQYAGDLNVARYRNMAYQIFRNDELDRYTEVYDQAARYCYLAAKAYDYETGLLNSESAGSEGASFMEEIVKARTLGRFASDGTPLEGNSTSDAGLADIMARMKANWSVLDGRLGFNNPQTETGRFSLRQELFRIKPSDVGGEESDEKWREKLETYRVDNLLELDEFNRYCLPFTPAELVEPALVIPFSTDISFAKNFFGIDLAGGDNAYDSTHFATKIRSAGVWFSNFDNAFSGGLANQPRVYLIPVGTDRMRVPSVSGTEIRNFQVVDQAMPIPYSFSESDWDSPDWSALKDVLGNELYDIRRYPSMRSYHDSGDFSESEVINNSRLIGRSVWNTQWMLIIPGRTLLSDGEEGLDRLIHGTEVYSGVRSEDGISDIKIFFQTYSYSGN